ncbi:MAG: heme exporter protein CcmD [Rhodospirillales bacterium]|nr:heme exporter protein CcmD [Rhodospirillales bacterium]
MENLSQLLEMGGYARFVWPSFGLTLAVLVGLLVVSRRALKGAEAELAALQSAIPGRLQPADTADEA